MKRMPWILFLFLNRFLFLFLVLGWTSALHAQQPPTTSHSLGSDLFIFGGSVRVEQPVSGDLIAAGGNVGVEAPVAGDAVLAGGNLRIGAPVGGSIYAGGGRLVVDAAVGRNLRIGGGQVDVGAKAVISGNVTLGGGQVSLRGPVKGAVTVGGGRVLIDSSVDGDVESAAGRITLGPNARIAGKLRYHSGNELERDPAAQVAGGVEQLAPPGRAQAGERADKRDDGDRHQRWVGPGWLWTLGLMVLGAVLVAAMPTLSQRMAGAWRERFGPSLLWGFIFLVCVPAAALILMISVIGIPVALLGLLLYGAALLVGYVASGIALGLWALVRWRADAVATGAWRVAATALALFGLALLGSLPYVGGFVALIAVIAGLGAIVQLVRPLAPAAAPRG